MEREISHGKCGKCTLEIIYTKLFKSMFNEAS